MQALASNLFFLLDSIFKGFLQPHDAFERINTSFPWAALADCRITLVLANVLAKHIFLRAQRIGLNRNSSRGPQNLLRMSWQDLGLSS